MKAGKSTSVVPSYTYIMLALLRSQSPNEKKKKVDLSILRTLIPSLDILFAYRSYYEDELSIQPRCPIFLY